MKRNSSSDPAREIAEAACRLMNHLDRPEHAMFEGLPDGRRLSIEIAVLPPVEEGATGAMRVLPPGRPDGGKSD